MGNLMTPTDWQYDPVRGILRHASAASSLSDRDGAGGCVAGIALALAELRPPAEHYQKPRHFIRHPDGSEAVWHWNPIGACWAWYNPEMDEADGYGCGYRQSAADHANGARHAYADGYRYLGPAEYLGAPAAFQARIVKLHPSQIQPDEDCPGLYLRCANAAQRRAIIDLLSAATDEPHARDPIGAPDDIHDRVERVIGDIAAGRVVAPARKALRDAVDKADAPLTGRAKSDAGIGRAIRYGGMVAP